MIRNASRRRVLVFVVIALAGMMAAPIDECDDYAFFRGGATTAHAGLPDTDCGECGETHGEGSSPQHVCSCLVCMLTTDDAFVPGLPPPQRGEAVTPFLSPPVSTAYPHPVFRPPIG